MKAIIGQQEETIQHLVDKIKDLFDVFLKVLIISIIYLYIINKFNYKLMIQS